MTESAVTEFQSRVGAFHALRTRDPNACVNLGVAQHLDALPDPGLAARAQDVRDARALLGQVQNLKADALNFDQALDRDLMALMLKAQIHRDSLCFNGRLAAAQTPTAAEDISAGIFMLFANDPRAPAERLANISARVAAVPEFLEAMCSRLDTPVARWVEIELEKLAELPGLWSSLLAWAKDVQWPAANLLRHRCELAQQAIAQYMRRLRAMSTTTQFQLDMADAQELVRLNGIDLSFAQLHGIAREFLARMGAELEQLRGRLVTKYALPADTSAAQLQRFLCQRFASAPSGPLDIILARYESERARVLAFIEQHQLFPVPPDQDMRIMRTPAFLAPSIPAGAMHPPPPFREGTRISLVYLTLTEELRDEHTELGIPLMMIHEGIPGHHLQLATASLHESVVRRHALANEHAEGWTTMLEDYMLDQGYVGDLTDEARFCGKLDLSRIGARVVIDLFFMTGDRDYLDVGVDCDIADPDPFVAAGNLLEKVTGFVPGRVQAELNWYSQERGYPMCYLTGNHLVWQLKADMAAHRPDLDARALDRLFHKTYLQAGNMPLSYLRRVFAHQQLIAHDND